MAEYSGYSAILQVDNSGYVTIGQVRDIDGPSLSMDASEASHRDSAFKKFTAGQVDPGEVSFEIVYDPDLATHSVSAAPGLPYYMINRTAKSFKLTFPDTSPLTATFTAFVTKFQPKLPMGDTMTASVTLKLSGTITWA